MLSCMQLTHTRAEQRLFNSLELCSYRLKFKIEQCGIGLSFIKTHGN